MENKKLIETNSIITAINFTIIIETVPSPISENSISNPTKNCRNNYDKQITYSFYINLIILSVYRATLIRSHL